ncbi:EscU/YscU/HrcU family type III secretion system export apparatus switch protein [Robbsia andropogonis]|uniref:EscU/YscU/HrcU family type III secretion system export apparatus switch protein n=1 Tax=Robbsia andropogonis TaxID=28092 RepID=UPI003D2019F3
MSEKTEKPTEKKRSDSEKKGQSFKAADLNTILLLAAGGLSAPYLFHWNNFGKLFSWIADAGAYPDPWSYVDALISIAAERIVAFVGICTLATAIPMLLQSRFTFAFNALKINFDALNPVNGFKKLFNLRVLKDAVKALLYLTAASASIAIFLTLHYRDLLGLAAMPEMLLRVELNRLGKSLGALLIATALPVLLLDYMVEYFLYIRSLKMDKHEIKEEVKESQGNPEVKSQQRKLSREGMSEKLKENVKGSTFVLANPTHIAIGVYVNFKVAPFPMVSVREQGERARSVIEYAMQCNVPVLRDVPLARRIYARSRRYEFIAVDDLEPILRVLFWLREIEKAGMPEPAASNTEPELDKPPEQDDSVPSD